MNAHKLLGSLALVSLLGIAACSDDSDSAATTTSATTKISKTEFLAQGNATCQTFNESLVELSANITTEEEQIAYMTDSLVPGLRATVASIRALGFPAGDEALLDGLMADTEVKLQEIEADPAAVLASGEDPFAEINSQLVDYGLTVCGLGGA